MKPQLDAIVFAKLRLLGDNLVPSEITKVLQHPPTFSATAREIEFSSRVPVRTFMTGVWDLETLGRVDSTLAEDHVQWLIDFLDDSHQLAIHLPSVEDAEIYCNWTSKHGRGGPSFSPALLGDVARHGLILTVDCHASCHLAD